MIAFIFSYLGISFFSSFMTNDWSYDLIGILCGALIVSRFVSRFGLIGLLRICGYKSEVSFKEIFFISYAGCVRGVICFGLVLRLTDVEGHRSVIVTTMQMTFHSAIIIQKAELTLLLCDYKN